MKARSIAAHENTFFETGRDSDGKEFIVTEKTVPIKGTNRVMPYVSCRTRNGDNSFYFHEKYPKTQIEA